MAVIPYGLTVTIAVPFCWVMKPGAETLTVVCPAANGSSSIPPAASENGV
jgi:hypothetical protein